MWLGATLIPSATSATGMPVSLASKSLMMLLWLGSRCGMKTKAIPVFTSMLRTNSIAASRPPAEAPIATNRRSEEGADATSAALDLRSSVDDFAGFDDLLFKGTLFLKAPTSRAYSRFLVDGLQC